MFQPIIGLANQLGNPSTLPISQACFMHHHVKDLAHANVTSISSKFSLHNISPPIRKPKNT